MRTIRIPLLLAILAAASTVLTIWYFFTLQDHYNYTFQYFPWPLSRDDAEPLQPIPDPTEDQHPIIQLALNAENDFNQLRNKETHDVASAAWAYREKRRRHPPPGFDKWHRYAQDNGAIIVEEFWDQIYHDLTPLWALSQKEMRDHVKAHNAILQIRKGAVTSTSDQFWMEIWKSLVKSIVKDLPDLDMAMNTMDEPRLFIPWEDMNKHVETEQKGRVILPAGTVTSAYSE
jgi:hypothetical protein